MGNTRRDQGTQGHLRNCPENEGLFQILGRSDNCRDIDPGANHVDDTINTTKTAIEENVITGNDMTLIHAINGLKNITLEDDQQIGIKIVKRTIKKPLKQITENAEQEGSIVVHFLRFV